MLETHKTRDGGTCLIAQMSDDHLRRMIELILRRVSEIEDKSKVDNLDPYHAALYGIKKVDPEMAATTNREAIRKLYPYLAEAFLRGMDDVRDRLVEAIGRDSALPGGLASLPSGAKVVTFYEDEEPPF